MKWRKADSPDAESHVVIDLRERLAPYEIDMDPDAVIDLRGVDRVDATPAYQPRHLLK